MGRKRDPEIQRMRERALELKKAGCSPKQISQEEEFVAFGADADTVRRWLREIRGPKPKARDEFRRLKAEGWSRAEILEELKISEGYYRRLDRELSGLKRVPAKRRIPTFFEDPERHRFAPWAMTESFAGELNSHVVTRVQDQPGTWTTAEETRYACEHFAALSEVRRGKARRWTLCQFVQAVANQAARQRSMDTPEYALKLLNYGRDMSERCLACGADLDRRTAIALRDLGRFEEALSIVSRAKTYYEVSADNGHDPFGNGLAHCAMAEANIHQAMGSYEVAIRINEEALSTVSPGGPLYGWLWHNTARAALRLGDQDIARDAVRRCEAQIDLYFPGPSQNRVRLYCETSRLHEAEGNVTGAIEALELALLDVEEKVNLPAAAAYILAELERLADEPDGLRLAVRIEDLGEVEEAAEKDSPPKWIEPLWLAAAAALFERVRLLARSGATEEVEKALQLLRVEGTSFMPSIA